MARNQGGKSRGGRNRPRRTVTRPAGAHLGLVTGGEPDVPASAASSPGHAVAGAPADDTYPVAGPPRELTAAVADSLIAAMAQARTALEAELVVSGALGTVEFGVDGDEHDIADATLALVAGVVEHADRVGSPDALATLRVFAALGSAGGRELAAAAADRVAATGVADRPWAARVGRPDVLRSWRYGDVLGAQSSLGVLFTDRGRDHALMVLVDHALGGGIKDAWVAEGRAVRGLRERVLSGIADEPQAVFEDVDVTTAAQALREAVASPPCPVEEDQIEDVVANLVLVRSRAERLAELAGPPLR